ncbi:hypothetical protein JCM10212_000677 [Sporobolomyces blumeae]
MRFGLFALVAIGLVSSVYAEASNVGSDALDKRVVIPKPGTLIIPLPVGPAKPAPPPPKPAPVVIKPPGTIKLPFRPFKRAVDLVKGLFQRAVIPKPGTLIIPLPVGPAKPAPPPPKPAPVVIKPPGTIKLPFRPWKRSIASCAHGMTACPIEGHLNSFSCVDVSSDATQCGDCAFAGGVNCREIEGVAGVACVNGFCRVDSCVDGWAFDFRKRSCVPAPKFWTQ